MSTLIIGVIVKALLRGASPLFLFLPPLLSREGDKGEGYHYKLKGGVGFRAD